MAADTSGPAPLRLHQVFWRVLFGLILLLGASPLPAMADGPLKKARLMLIWCPQAQFAGYYMAREKGIYARHGIDLTIIEGGPGRSPLQSLLYGETEFAVLWLATALKQQETGLALVNLAQIIQRSSLMLVARKTSGIAAPKDLQGRKVGVWDDELALPILAFLEKYRLKVRRIPQAYTVNLFLRGGVDAVSAMWYNEYHTILSAGIDPEELQIFSLHEHGISVPEDGLYTLENVYQRDPALARAFARASLEGWQYAFAHPEETVEVMLRVMREAKVPASRSHQQWMLARMRDLVLPEDPTVPLGRLQLHGFEAAGRILRDHGVIGSLPDYRAFIGEE